MEKAESGDHERLERVRGRGTRSEKENVIKSVTGASASASNGTSASATAGNGTSLS